MTSLQKRLNRVVLVLLVGLIVQWLVADRMIVWVDESEMATHLHHDADSLFAALDPGTGSGPQLDPRVAGTIYQRPYSGHYFVMRVGGRQFHSASFGDTRPFHLPTVQSDTLEHADGPRGQPLLVLTTSVDVEGKTITLSVAEDLTPMRAQLLGFRLLFVALSVAVLAAAVWVQRRELKWALKPLSDARDAMLQVPAGGKPVFAVDAPEEIRPLVDEIERLLAFVERRLEKSRTAIGNLSHAVKTPLSAIFRLLDDARIAEHADLRRRIQEQANTIHQRIDRELKRARLAGDHPVHGHFEPRAELPALVQLLRQIHADRQVGIEWSAPANPLPYDREDMLELIGNLADNACKWAAARVAIEIRDLEGIDVVVSDDGPGCAPDALAGLGRRGERSDESVAGYGLGLAIARDIVELFGGKLAFGRSAALGGLEVTAHLPR
ncbi:MAG: sensor histidine kinase [Casimicrobiaceae bacterium]